jgi:hypothetical protein
MVKLLQVLIVGTCQMDGCADRDRDGHLNVKMTTSNPSVDSRGYSMRNGGLLCG